MTKLVLLHKADSIYDDEPDKVYDFPRSYLKAMREAVGDWIVYYEPVNAGPRGYFAAGNISHAVEKPGAEGRFLALIEPACRIASPDPGASILTISEPKSTNNWPQNGPAMSWRISVTRRLSSGFGTVSSL